MSSNMMVRFSARNVLVIGVVALVVGTLVISGWLVYQHQMSASSTTQPKTNGYLDITEWGIKIPLSSGIKDVYYAPNVHGSYSPDGLPDQILVGFKSLDSHGCAVAANAAPVLFFRGSPSQVDPVSGDVVTKVYPGVTIGGYFYGYSLTKNVSCDDATTFQNLDAALKIAVKGIVLDTSHK